jgi:hypothetical protein
MLPPPLSEEDAAWLPAIQAAEDGDLRPLIARLQSTGIGWGILVADLLSRRRLRKRRGGQRHASYRKSEPIAALISAANLVRRHARYATDRDTAIEDVAREFSAWGVTAEQLRQYLNELGK